MILAAIVLFCLAALLGLWLVVLGVRYRRGSRALAAGHAGVALLGLILLGRHIFSSPVHMLYNDAALLFVLALFGGLVLLALRMGNHEHRSPPPMMGVSHHFLLCSTKDTNSRTNPTCGWLAWLWKSSGDVPCPSVRLRGFLVIGNLLAIRTCER